METDPDRDVMTSLATDADPDSAPTSKSLLDADADHANHAAPATPFEYVYHTSCGDVIGCARVDGGTSRPFGVGAVQR